MATEQPPDHYRIWTLEKDDVSYELHIYDPNTPDDALTTGDLHTLLISGVSYPTGIAYDGLPSYTDFPLVLRTNQSPQAFQSPEIFEKPAIIPTDDLEMAARQTAIILQGTPLEGNQQAIQGITQKLQDITLQLTPLHQDNGRYAPDVLLNKFHKVAPSASV